MASNPLPLFVTLIALCLMYCCCKIPSPITFIFVTSFVNVPKLNKEEKRQITSG